MGKRTDEGRLTSDEIVALLPPEEVSQVRKSVLFAIFVDALPALLACVPVAGEVLATMRRGQEAGQRLEEGHQLAHFATDLWSVVKQHERELRATLESLLGLGITADHVWDLLEARSATIRKRRLEVAVPLGPIALRVAEYYVGHAELGTTWEELPDTASIFSAMDRVSVADFHHALDKLEEEGYLKLEDALGSTVSATTVQPLPLLFKVFDPIVHGTVPVDDAAELLLALADLDGDADVSDVASSLGWQPRRLNPALIMLLHSGLVDDLEYYCEGTWETPVVGVTASTWEAARKLRGTR